MTKQYAAVGIFAEDDSVEKVPVPDDMNEVLAKLDAIVDKYEQGDVLSPEDHAIVASYLPVVGVDDTDHTEFDALIGTGSFEFDRSEDGLDVHVDGNCGCHSTGEGRIEWWSEMGVAKTGGDTAIKAFDFTMRGASFGMGPSGKMKMIYKRDFTREFINADAARMSFNDRYVFIQWGFFFSCTCTLTTDKGDITIR